MSFINIINHLSAYIPEQLISINYLSKIIKVISSLSIKNDSTFGFESILNRNSKSADFSIEILNCNFSFYKDNYNFFFTKPNLEKYIELVWIEFDISTNIKTKPKFFLKLYNNLNNTKLVYDIFKFTKKNIDFITENKIENLLKLIIQTNKIIKYIGLSENNSNLRFSIEFLNIDSIVSFLKKININSFNLNMVEKLKIFYKYCDYLILNIDIWYEINPIFSIEFKVNDIFSNYKNRWKEFLVLLHSLNYCKQNKYECLLNWPGCDREIFNEILYKYNTYRLINHIKVTIYNDNLIWKIYYGFINKLIEKKKND